MRDWLVRMRGERGLTREEVCVRSGIPFTYYTEIEKARRQVDMRRSMVERLARGLGVTAQEVLEAEEEWCRERESLMKARRH